MAKVWVQSYDAEVKMLAESYYYKAFRRKVPESIDSVIFLHKKEFVQKCIDAKLERPYHDTIAFLYPKESFLGMMYRIYVRCGHLDVVLENLGHELFHTYLDIEILNKKIDGKKLDDYVIDEAFAHLGSWFYHDQLKKDLRLKEECAIKDFNLALPKNKEHRRGYRLTNTLVQKFYPRYFTPVKRILLESSIDDIVTISGLPKHKLMKT